MKAMWGFMSVVSLLYEENNILKCRVMQNVSVGKFTLLA
jgi:hypothetical protein